jgi:hypothetical protein
MDVNCKMQAHNVERMCKRKNSFNECSYMISHTCVVMSSSVLDYHKGPTINLKGGLWFFVSFRIFFPDNTRVRILFFFVAQSAIFFLQNLTLGYMTKTLNQIIFFSSTKMRIFLSATLGIRTFFFRKNPLNGRSLSI